MADKPKKEKLLNTENQEGTDPVVTTAIGKQLKRLYDEFADEPVPDRFADLLEQLARQERETGQ